MFWYLRVDWFWVLGVWCCAWFCVVCIVVLGVLCGDDCVYSLSCGGCGRGGLLLLCV